MVKRRNNAIVFVILLLSLGYAYANSASKCPESIKTKQELQLSVDGWQGVVYQRVHGFSRMGFRMKNDLGELRSDSEDKRNGLTVLRWKFSENDEIEQFCEYKGTSVTLTRKVNAKSCEIIQKSSTNSFVSVDCR